MKWKHGSEHRSFPRSTYKHGANTGNKDIKNLLDQGIEYARSAGMYVIIDWHSIGNLKSELFQSDNYETTQKETFEFWRSMSQRYKDNTTVAFFELFNEPTVINGQAGACLMGRMEKINEENDRYLRGYGCKAIPLVAGFNWAYDLTPVKTIQSMLKASPVSHPYPMKRSKPWNPKWTTDWGFVVEKYPLILTEIGFCYPDDVGAYTGHEWWIPWWCHDGVYKSKEGFPSVMLGIWSAVAPRMFSDWNYTSSHQGKYWKAALNTSNRSCLLDKDSILI